MIKLKQFFYFSIYIIVGLAVIFVSINAQPTNATDRANMLTQLGITLPTLPSKLVDPNRITSGNARPSNAGDPEGNWTDDAGHTITRSDFGQWTNYDDKSAGYVPGPDSFRVGEYTPINPLKMTTSSYIVASAAQWWNMRRPETLKDCQEQMWGVIPPDSIWPAITWSTVVTTGGSGASAYRQKVIKGTISTSRYPSVRNVPQIACTLRTPLNATGRVPVMIVFAGAIGTYWGYAQPQGWGACTFNCTALQPDNGAGLTSYIIGLCNKGNWRTPTDWGALAAWAWGASRILDYMGTDADVDTLKVGITGHSRYGKAALVTMAYDQRFAIAFPSCGGSLGTKMNRYHWGQNLENSAWDQEYHWMAGNFFRWMGEYIPGQHLPRMIEDCPVDAHSLFALCAPRPVFANGGAQDSWNGPYGIFLALKEATPVYELLGEDGLIMTDPKPVVNTAYISGKLGHRYHAEGHTDSPDWPAFWQFATAALATDVEQDINLKPAEFSLSQNYPNPFNPSTVIDYRITAKCYVNLKVYDSLGREIAALVDGEKAPGGYSVTFNAANYASGVYYYSMHAGNQTLTRAMFLIK